MRDINLLLTLSLTLMMGVSNILEVRKMAVHEKNSPFVMVDIGGILSEKNSDCSGSTIGSGSTD